mmetsp:Transcript_32717/g.110182  ORF Transcript_32717/g.110182 Transcript_32717/m.110182 type:complete len:243 (-) Transcript_32717:641-1369(-)
MLLLHGHGETIRTPRRPRRRGDRHVGGLPAAVRRGGGPPAAVRVRRRRHHPRRARAAVFSMLAAAAVGDVVSEEGTRSGDGDGPQREPARHRRSLCRRGRGGPQRRRTPEILRGHHRRLCIRRGRSRARLPAAAAHAAVGVCRGDGGAEHFAGRGLCREPGPAGADVPRHRFIAAQDARVRGPSRGVCGFDWRDQRRFGLCRRRLGKVGTRGVDGVRRRGFPSGHCLGGHRARLVRRRDAAV